MSDNTLVASDLFSGGHMNGYSGYFEKKRWPTQVSRFQPVKVKSCVANNTVFR